MATEAKKVQQQEQDSKRTGYAGNGTIGSGQTHAITKAPEGFLEVLLAIFKDEGLEGLYRGCGAQIFTAVSKAGILLTTKEKIAAFALGLLAVFGKRRTLA